MSAQALSEPSPDAQFALERLERLLCRRVQVAIAIQQVPRASGNGRLWLVRALDGAIADEYCQLQRLGLAEQGRALLAGFRQALDKTPASRGHAA